MHPHNRQTNTIGMVRSLIYEMEEYYLYSNEADNSAEIRSMYRIRTAAQRISNNRQLNIPIISRLLYATNDLQLFRDIMRYTGRDIIDLLRSIIAQNLSGRHFLNSHRKLF